MPYSMDFREAVAAAYDECGSSAEAAEQFGCSASWVRRLVQHRRERGTLAPRSTARAGDQRTYTDADEAAIRALVRDKPDATLAEVAAALGKPAAESTVSRTLTRLGLPRKKSPRTPPSSSGPMSRPPGPGGSARPRRSPASG